MISESPLSIWQPRCQQARDTWWVFVSLPPHLNLTTLPPSHPTWGATHLLGEPVFSFPVFSLPVKHAKTRENSLRFSFFGLTLKNLLFSHPRWSSDLFSSHYAVVFALWLFGWHFRHPRWHEKWVVGWLRVYSSRGRFKVGEKHLGGKHAEMFKCLPNWDHQKSNCG